MNKLLEDRMNEIEKEMLEKYSNHAVLTKSVNALLVDVIERVTKESFRACFDELAGMADEQDKNLELAARRYAQNWSSKGIVTPEREAGFIAGARFITPIVRAEEQKRIDDDYCYRGECGIAAVCKESSERQSKYTRLKEAADKMENDIVVMLQNYWKDDQYPENCEIQASRLVAIRKSMLGYRATLAELEKE